jgi:cytochrome o ubiquinol oxidase subunit 2
MNSFFVPQLGSQIYTMSGMVTRLHLQADQPGSYRGMSAQFSGEGFADMYFNVEAVAPEKFSEWVDTARNVGVELNATTYAELAKPSSSVTPFTYRAVAPGLFGSIMVSDMQSDDALCGRNPTSMRAEK